MYNNIIFIPKTTKPEDVYSILQPFLHKLSIINIEPEEGISKKVIKEIVRIKLQKN